MEHSSVMSQTYAFYRQTIDLYGSVPSPSINFLGPPSLSQLGSSFMSSSFIRRHTPEILPSLSKPLISEVEKPREGRSGRYPLSPTLSRRSSLRKAVLDKRASVAHEPPISGQSTYGQAVINCSFNSSFYLKIYEHNLLHKREMRCVTNCRHECFMWSGNPFDTVCCTRRRVVRTCYINGVCWTFFLHWDSVEVLSG